MYDTPCLLSLFHLPTYLPTYLPYIGLVEKMQGVLSPDQLTLPVTKLLMDDDATAASSSGSSTTTVQLDPKYVHTIPIYLLTQQRLSIYLPTYLLTNGYLSTYLYVSIYLPRVFGVPVRKDIVHRVVTWQRAKRRLGLASTKRAGEIR